MFRFPGKLFAAFFRRIWLQYFVREFSPVSLFLVAGLFLSAFGTAWGLVHWVRSAQTGVEASTGTVMIAVVPLILEPMIASFCQAYPEIELEIAASDEMVDLATGGFDAGIRLGQFIAADMIAVRLTPSFPFVVVGSPGYLERHGRPERVEDLRHHACLRLRRSNGAIAPWSFVDGNGTIEALVSGPLIAHDYPTLVGAAMRGVGLAQIPRPVAEGPIAAGKLEPVLDGISATTPGVFLYHPGKRQILPKLRAFIDHVKAA